MPICILGGKLHLVLSPERTSRIRYKFPNIAASARVTGWEPHPAIPLSGVSVKLRRAFVTAGSGLLLLSPWAGPYTPTLQLGNYTCSASPDHVQTLQHVLFGPPPALAALFQDDKDDSIDPFTLYGSTRKKYSIEQKDGEKILSRRSGFTVNTCVTGSAESDESAVLRRLTGSDKVVSSDNQVCREVEGQELKSACAESCTKACTDGLQEYKAASQAFSGLTLGEADERRLIRSCQRNCTYQCNKPGNGYFFRVPYRR